MGSMESPDDGSLWEMTLGSSPIHRALTLFCPLEVSLCEPLASRVIGTSLQSKGAPVDVSHKADVAPTLIRGGRASALNEKKKKKKEKKKKKNHNNRYCVHAMFSLTSPLPCFQPSKCTWAPFLLPNMVRNGHTTNTKPEIIR